ncbi:hypothetical protein MHO82_07285 [Vibrio sp. Of7-15]|uniref:hypothetical protein n=1 Tax=Vibrio sp. Of7-15 TaxID=2724879 RepID=UPI001EF39777|nr:hypothetical protein [Vibrio sp. Of7-15]MCG7496661.1 hypothetical protein [Vibrio sp. Of7-15]
MKKIFVAATLLALAGCNSEDSSSYNYNSSSNSYSSCRIIKSEAADASDRTKDLQQCWSAFGNGYSSKSMALSWCEREVTDYMRANYLFNDHNVTYQVSTSSCP